MQPERIVELSHVTGRDATDLAQQPLGRHGSDLFGLCFGVGRETGCGSTQ